VARHELPTVFNPLMCRPLQGAGAWKSSLAEQQHDGLSCDVRRVHGGPSCDGTSESAGRGEVGLEGLPGVEEQGWAVQERVGASSLGLSEAALEEQHPFRNPGLDCSQKPSFLSPDA
jgi:hypothetical protein